MNGKKWWPGVELNRRHADFQSQADICNSSCNNRLTGGACCNECPTMPDRVDLTSAKFPHEFNVSASTVAGVTSAQGGCSR